ncbi:MAG: PAS domain-containing protein, partial [Sulfolobales archaeon]
RRKRIGCGFSESSIFKGFVRTKTIIGRKVEYCHPPRLEAFVMQNVKSVKNGEAPYKEYWTRIGGKIVRVLIAPVKGEDGKLLGVLEVVEDMTEIINKAEEIKKKIVVL